jgi:hypothetical protein
MEFFIKLYLSALAIYIYVMLSVFYPVSYVDDVSMFDMKMRSSSTNPDLAYKFYIGQAVFPFDHGLSYTTFNYSFFDHCKNVFIFN